MANFKSIIKQSFTQYSAAVIQSRALVDVRDGLKPSARQIFYSMLQHKLTSDKPYKKTANAVGMAMADYYIHGNSSCEGVIMRAGQSFAMRYPLMDVKGNAGTLIESGNWAAMRYTESRLSPLMAGMFKDIDKETITEWRDNYDNTKQFPAVLPTKGFYNIVNGTQGISVGMASSIPQYNLRELNAALIKLINNPDCSFDDIYCAPDFATGGILYNEDEVKESMKTGNGYACKLRSVIDYDVKENCFIVTEIPYGVYTNTICGELEEIVNSENNPGIDRFNDLTGKTPLIKIYLSKKANVNKILQFLYKNTSLQHYYGINFTMLDHGRFPKVFTWKEMLQAHIDHEKEVYRRGFEYDKAKAEKRVHIIDGLLTCLASIDLVVAAIKQSESVAKAKEALMTQFLLDEEQSKAVLDLKLSRLAHLEVKKLENEKDTLLGEIARIINILNSDVLFNNELIAGWREIASKYGDDRRTKVISPEVAEMQTEAPNEQCVVVVSAEGFIKRIATSAFKPQNRNTIGTKTKDAIKFTCATSTKDQLFIFTSLGKMYKINVADIPEGDNRTKGAYINTLIAIDDKEEAIAFTTLLKGSHYKYIIFATQNGFIKKTELEEYLKSKASKGIVAIKLKDGDSIAAIDFINNEDIVMVADNGCAIRFNSAEVAATGKISMGVKGQTLTDGAKVITAIVLNGYSNYICTVSEEGLGKMFDIQELSVQKRAGKGVLICKPPIAAALLLKQDDNILITGDKSSVCISAKDIPIQKRTTVGNGLIKNNKVVCVTKL